MLFSMCVIKPALPLNLLKNTFQHRMGGDRKEICMAAPVDPMNRLAMKGPFREIEVVFDRSDLM